MNGKWWYCRYGVRSGLSVVVLGKGDNVVANDSLSTQLASEELRVHYRKRIVSPLLRPSIAGMWCLHIHCSKVVLTL